MFYKEEQEGSLVYHLNNGLRVVYTRVKSSPNVFCALMVGAGSRYETETENGMAHLIEHMLFKKTKKRSAYQILNRIESVGGDLNAYTTRERTCFYTSAQKKYLDRSFELLIDLVFNYHITDKNLEKEKSVIFEEIDMYLDSPEETVYDEFHQLAFPGQTIGNAILGTKSTLEKIHAKDVNDFLNRNYVNERIVISIAGNFSPSRIENLLKKYLGDMNQNKAIGLEFSESIYHSFKQKSKKDFQQVHAIIGNKAPSIHDTNKYAVFLLNNILGGEWMSSRLNMSVREKHAYVYSIYTGYNIYSDNALYTIQFGTDKRHIENCLSLIDKELKKIKNKKVSAAELKKARRQTEGQYSLYYENASFVVQTRAKNVLDYGHIVTLEDYSKNINAVTENDIIEQANALFDESTLSSLIYFKED